MTLGSYLNRQAELLRTTITVLPQTTVDEAIGLLLSAWRSGGTILVCGNGGSAADSMHIVGELVGKFTLERPPFRAIALCDNPATLTAWSNDYSYESVFARQVEAYGSQGSVLWALSTSGNSRNVLAALEAARERSIPTICLTGRSGGQCAALADVLLAVPAEQTAEIQQLHLCLYHYMCERLEHLAFGPASSSA